MSAAIKTSGIPKGARCVRCAVNPATTTVSANNGSKDAVCAGCVKQPTIASESSEYTRWACPKCKGEKLEVAIEVSARLIQHADGDFETSIEDAQFQDHEWGENSVMTCIDCGERSIADDFEVRGREVKDDAPEHTKRLSGYCPVCGHYGEDCTGIESDIPFEATSPEVSR